MRNAGFRTALAQSGVLQFLKTFDPHVVGMLPGELANLTLSTHAVELLRSGAVTIKQVRNVKPVWNQEEMDHRSDRSIGRGGNPPKDRFGDIDTVGNGLVA